MKRYSQTLWGSSGNSIKLFSNSRIIKYIYDKYNDKKLKLINFISPKLDSINYYQWRSRFKKLLFNLSITSVIFTIIIFLLTSQPFFNLYGLGLALLVEVIEKYLSKFGSFLLKLAKVLK